MSATLLFLPPRPDDDWRWLRVEDDAVVARGEGLPAVTDELIAVAPADAVTLHWANLPARSPAQAAAAARILIADASAAPAETLHVAVGAEAGEERPIGVVARGDMQAWLDRLAAAGFDPANVVPAPMLLPRPDTGYVRADLGGQSVVRGATSGFADEARLTALVTGETAPETLGRDAVEAAMVAAAANPALNLRQGAFAKRRRRAIDWALVRRLAVLGGLVLLATLAIDLARITKYAIAANTAEAETAAIARQGLPRGADQGDPDRLLAERLSRLRGPGAGFSATTATVASAVRGVEGTELVALAFAESGELRATVTAEGEAQANQLVARLRESGFVVTASTFEASGNRVRGDLTLILP